ncbi:MAG: recombination mediator RecR [Christensenellales bacterium]|jgi:recombination protein RecR
MIQLAQPIAQLVNQLSKLPGIGPKSAQRLAYHILALPRHRADELAEAIRNAQEKIRQCELCFNFSEGPICPICADEQRKNGILCVVQGPRDVLSLEKTREFKGRYHVLGGVISPMDGIGPDDLHIKELLARLETEQIHEVILATSLDVEGEATALYVARLIKPLGVKTTRIAHGIPVGADLEYADETTLAKALEGRREI